MILALILTNLLCFGSLFYFYKREKKRFFNYIAENLDPGSPSQIFAFTDVLAKQIGQAAIASVKGTVNQTRATEAKHEKSLEAAIAGDLISSKSPIMAWISQMPQVQALLKKNPSILPLAMQYFANKTPAGNNHNKEYTSVDSFNLNQF